MMSTRDRILAAAVDEVNAVGLSDFRLARVAQAAGVTQAVIYQYFDGREGLITAGVAAWTIDISSSTSEVIRKQLDEVASFEDLRLSETEYVRATDVETDQLLRWSIAETLVLSWFYPDRAQAALAVDQTIFDSCVAMFERMLGPAEGRSGVTAKTVAYFASSVWFGGLLSPGGLDNELESRLTTMVLTLAEVVATEPEPVDRDWSDRELISLSFPVEDPMSGSTRERIVRATQAEVHAVGPVKVTVKNVALRAGVSSALIIHHFSNRTKLLAAASIQVPEDMYREMRDLFLGFSATVQTPEDLIEFAATVATIGMGVDDDVSRFRRRIVEALIHARHDPEALEQANDLARRYLADTTAVLERLQAVGLVSHRFPADEMATLMFRFQWGRVLFDGNGAQSPTVDEVRQLGILLYRDVFGVR